MSADGKCNSKQQPQQTVKDACEIALVFSSLDGVEKSRCGACLTYKRQWIVLKNLSLTCTLPLSV